MTNIEYEVKFLEIDVQEIKEKLENIGANYLGKKNFKRYIYDFNPVDKNKWIRLRTDGTETFLTIKEITGKEIGDVKEFEIEVKDFNETNELLNHLGFISRGIQENIRETWKFDGIEFDIDTWPLIPTLLEIEGKNQEEVKKGIKLLGLLEKDSTTDGIIEIFSHYGIDLRNLKELKF